MTRRFLAWLWSHRWLWLALVVLAMLLLLPDSAPRSAAVIPAGTSSRAPAEPDRRLSGAPNAPAIGSGGQPDVDAGPHRGAPNPTVPPVLGSRVSHQSAGSASPPSSSARPLSCASPCFVDVAEWDVPTPDVGFLVRKGKASNYGPKYSEWWVALPDGPGWRFRVCGPGDCRTLVSTDAGPSLAMQREGRVVDLPVGAFEAVCGVSWRMGLCNVEVTILGRVRG